MMETTTLITATKIIGILLMVGSVVIMIKIYRDFRWRWWII